MEKNMAYVSRRGRSRFPLKPNVPPIKNLHGVVDSNINEHENDISFKNSNFKSEGISTSGYNMQRCQKPAQSLYIMQQRNKSMPNNIDNKEYSSLTDENPIRKAQFNRNVSDYSLLSKLSEPKNYYNGVINDKQRHTRGTEMQYSDRMFSSRKRNSTAEKGIVKLPSNIDALPPRLQKKFILENGLDMSVLKNHQIRHRVNRFDSEKFAGNKHQSQTNNDRIRSRSSDFDYKEHHFTPENRTIINKNDNLNPNYHCVNKNVIEKQEKPMHLHYNTRCYNKTRLSKEEDEQNITKNYNYYGHTTDLNKHEFHKFDLRKKRDFTASKQISSTRNVPLVTSTKDYMFADDNMFKNDLNMEQFDWSEDVDKMYAAKQINNLDEETSCDQSDIRHCDYKYENIVQNEDKSSKYSSTSASNTQHTILLKHHGVSRNVNFPASNTPGILVVRTSEEVNTKSNFESKPLMDSKKSSIVTSRNDCENMTEFKTPTKFPKSGQHFYVRPSWYDTNKYKIITMKLIKKIEKADFQVQMLMNKQSISENWSTVLQRLADIQYLLELLLINDMKFCREENVEHHIWKILYYNIIELLRNYQSESPSGCLHYSSKGLELIENGITFYENMLKALEKNYKFNLDDYLGSNAGASIKGSKYVTLALVCAQKLFLFLGDLCRYREQFNSTKNYGKAKQLYIKAQQLMPTNGMPYNQLAIISLYTKRKFDAVYYHMRSLTSSNPIQSAKESLKELLDEVRKKYETTQKKRKDKGIAPGKEKDGQIGGALRCETWIHPADGRRIQRTAPLQSIGETNISNDEESLKQMDAIELNKRFITSYLHVHGKLFTKIGMDTFLECTTEMLKEFHLLLQHSPVVLTSQRLIQLMALNMFAIDSTQLRDSSMATVRSEVQEYAISMSICMFDIILEKFLIILKDATKRADKKIYNEKGTEKCENYAAETYVHNNGGGQSQRIANHKVKISCLSLPEDAKVILPAIKIWCDWLSNNTSIWNPPSRCIDYNKRYDPWKGLALLMTLLDKINIDDSIYSVNPVEEYDWFRLPEDINLLGFTLSTKNHVQQYYCDRNEDIELVQQTIRLHQIFYFGTVFLCNLHPPVLEQIIHGNSVDYVSKILNTETKDSDLMLDNFSDSEELDVPTYEKLPASDDHSLDDSLASDLNAVSIKFTHDENTTEICKLLKRKDELEHRHRMQERNNQRLQTILKQSTVSLNIEVRPKYLVPDTNCFIDFLDQLKTIANAHPLYQLIVPLVVINELEGLSRGGKNAAQSTNSSVLDHSNIIFSSPTALKKKNYISDQHVADVAIAAQDTLSFLKSKHPAVKCVTTKGSFLNSLVFTYEDDKCDQLSNDDKILLTASNLCNKQADEKIGKTKFIVREVVLLTTDRNLRVKALSQNVPVRELPDFMKWSGLGPC